ncbi:MAG: DUF465 domain-containing protein [Pseudomonadota bacterium]
MTVTAHLTQLKRKHAALSRTVEQEQRRPGSDDLELRRLKREKLRLKEEIARLDPAHA